MLGRSGSEEGKGEKGKEKEEEKRISQNVDANTPRSSPSTEATQDTLAFCDLYLAICDSLEKIVAKTGCTSETIAETGYDANVYPIFVDTSREAFYNVRTRSPESIKSLPEKHREKAQGVIIDNFQESMSRKSIMKPNEKNLPLLNELCQYVEKNYSEADKKMAMPALINIFHVMYNIYHQHDCAETELEKLSTAIEQFTDLEEYIRGISLAISNLESIPIDKTREKNPELDEVIVKLKKMLKEKKEEKKLPEKLSCIFDTLKNHASQYLSQFQENKELYALSFEEWVAYCKKMNCASSLKHMPLKLSDFEIDEQLGLIALKHLLDLLVTLEYSSTKTDHSLLYIYEAHANEIKSTLPEKITLFTEQFSSYTIKTPQEKFPNTTIEQRKFLNEKLSDILKNDNAILFGYMLFKKKKAYINDIRQAKLDIKWMQTAYPEKCYQMYTTIMAFNICIAKTKSHKKKSRDTATGSCLNIGLYLYIFLLIMNHISHSKKKPNEDLIRVIAFCKIIFDKMTEKQNINIEQLFLGLQTPNITSNISTSHSLSSLPTPPGLGESSSLDSPRFFNPISPRRRKTNSRLCGSQSLTFPHSDTGTQTITPQSSCPTSSSSSSSSSPPYPTSSASSSSPPLAQSPK